MEAGEGVWQLSAAPITSGPLILWWILWWLQGAHPLPLLLLPHRIPDLFCPQLLQKLISGVFFLALRILFREKGNTWIVLFPKTLPKESHGI